VVAMAAYRAGAKLNDERRGCVVDYSRKRGIVHAEIMAPEGSAEWLRDRERLWNHVETLEHRRDAQLAREINVALPHELTDAQRLDLVREFVGRQFVNLGMVADIAIHRPVAVRGDDPRNHHAHILLTLRQAEARGLRRVKTREWNSDKLLVGWRAAWAACQNEALARGGHRALVDHRSLAVQKAAALEKKERTRAVLLDRQPEVHVGPKVRKSGVEAPRSRDVVVGPFRKLGAGKPARRVKSYTKLDKGSRAAWNVRRLRSNAVRFQMRADKAGMRLGKLRQLLSRYERDIAAAGLGPVSQDQGTRLRRAQARRFVVLLLIDRLDRLMTRLLGIREHQLMRSTLWGNRLKARDRAGPWRSREL